MSSARLAARKVAHQPNRPRFPAPTVLLSALVPAFLVVAPAPAASQLSEVQMEWGVAIPIRDGVNLHGTIYRPANQQEPLPVILGFTPYISDVYHGKARYYASRGYVFAAVDVRGRGNSEGTFEPFKDADRDGHDVVEWLAAQPWSNGKVAMYGASYGGWDQWATAKELPPGLSSIVPAAAAYLGTDFPFVHNVFVPYNMTWLTFTSGNAAQSTIFGDMEMWTAAFTERYVDHRPFAELDEIVGNPTTHFQTWLEHPTPDEYWKATVPTPAQLAAMDIPILTITGHYDGDQRGALQHYRMHMQHGNEAAKARHYLVIGPWNHGGVGTSVSSVGGLEFGPNALLPQDSLRKAWYDWTLKDGPRPWFLEKRVAVYIAGRDTWEYADALDEVANDELLYYFDSADGRPNDVFHSGTLSSAPSDNTAAASYVYDPLDTRPGLLEGHESGNNLAHFFWGETPLNEHYALNLFDNGLVYHTEQFETATEIAGFLELDAWMSLDVPDTDFMVTVYEIRPDGSSVFLTGDIMRARHRNSREIEELATPGEVNLYRFDGFQFLAREVAKGSRLRLILNSPNSVWLQKNYNSGGRVTHESGADARTATVTFHHGGAYRSRLRVPVRGRPVS